MPRSIRHECEEAVYHVICSGNNGQDIFRDDTNGRMAGRLRMSDRSNVSRALRSMNQVKIGGQSNLRQKMTQCTG